MGLLNKIFGGANGIREAMRDSYAQHVRLVESGRFPAPSGTHAAALFGALGSRYRVALRPHSEMQLWPELAPFLAMPSGEGVAMLAEYVVYQQMRQSADVAMLSISINRAIVNSDDSEHLTLAAVACFIHRAPWSELLQPEAVSRLRSEMESQMGQGKA